LLKELPKPPPALLLFIFVPDEPNPFLTLLLLKVLPPKPPPALLLFMFVPEFLNPLATLLLLKVLPP
jgi:hypothetical protein